MPESFLSRSGLFSATHMKNLDKYLVFFSLDCDTRLLQKYFMNGRTFIIQAQKLMRKTVASDFYVRSIPVIEINPKQCQLSVPNYFREYHEKFSNYIVHQLHFLTCKYKCDWTRYIAKFLESTWGLPGTCLSQMGPMLAPWTLLSGRIMPSSSSSSF